MGIALVWSSIDDCPCRASQLWNLDFRYGVVALTWLNIAYTRSTSEPSALSLRVTVVGRFLRKNSTAPQGDCIPFDIKQKSILFQKTQKKTTSLSSLYFYFI